MKKVYLFREIVILSLILTWSSPINSAARFERQDNCLVPKVLGSPNIQYEAHRIGRVGLTVTNFGTVGTGFISNPVCDGEICPSCEFPVNSDLEYLFAGAIWVGAVAGSDTLVSVGADGWFSDINEFLPDEGTMGEIITRSNIPSRANYHPDAISEQDIICVFTDTFTNPGLTGIDPLDNRPHIPLNIELVRASYAWSYSYLEDIVIFNYNIKNIGPNPLESVWIGIYMDGDVYHKSHQSDGSRDDIAGFFPEENLAYIIDNDGDPDPSLQYWTYTSPLSVMGLKFHGVDKTFVYPNFNWWVSNGNSVLDFGPRLAGSEEDPFRSFGKHLGTPTGDRNKYYILSHPEQDYDQLFTAISHVEDGFLEPPTTSLPADIADGYDTRFLLSFGPFYINPAATVTFGYSLIMGEDIHVDPTDFADYFDPDNPQAFYEHLDFTDLIENAHVADLIYSSLPLTADRHDNVGLPSKFTISQNYPNPFNPVTTIEYTLPRKAQVEIAIYNLLGRMVRTLVNETKAAGIYQTQWDGKNEKGLDVATGIYFYRFQMDNHVETKKMMLLR